MLGTSKAVGDIDSATAPAFNGYLHDTIDTTDETRVVVDCSDLTFIDTAGFHVLVDATEYATRRGRRLVLRDLPRSCAMLIRLCDWDDELCVEP